MTECGPNNIVLAQKASSVIFFVLVIGAKIKKKAYGNFLNFNLDGFDVKLEA